MFVLGVDIDCPVASVGKTTLQLMASSIIFPCLVFVFRFLLTVC